MYQKKQSRFCSELSVLCFGAIWTLTAVAVPVNADEARIFFASDVHDNPQGLKTFLDSACGADSPCDTVALVGDYNASYIGRPTAAPEGWPQSIDSDMTALLNMIPSTTDRVIAGGNHDILLCEAGKIHPTGLVTTSMAAIDSRTSLSDNPLYDMWVINYNDFGLFGDQDPNLEGEQISSSRAALEQHIIANPKKVHFILTHYPLHSNREKSTRPEWPQAAKSLFSFLNKWGAGREIVVLWGHNHNGNFDQEVNFAARRGEHICSNPTQHDNIAEVCDAALTFTYLNAGYIRTPTYSSPTPLSSFTVVTVDDSDFLVERHGAVPATLNIERRKLQDVGDVNKDGTLTIVDALMVAQYIVGLNPKGFYIDSADVNVDGAVTIVDALIIAQYTVGLIPALPIVMPYTLPVVKGNIETMDDAVRAIEDAMSS